MNVGRRPWTEAECELLRRHYADTPTADLAEVFGRSATSVYGKAQQMDLAKSPEFLAGPASGRLQGRDNGRRFAPGHDPWNKGQKGWQAGGRSCETRFRPGDRPQTWVPVGTETLSKDGYLKRKVRDDAPPGMSRRNWRFVHVLLWEQHHGPVPSGYAVCFMNGDKRDIRIENLELRHRRQLMARNSVHNLPEPLKGAIRAKAALVRVINHRREEREERDR